MVKYKTKTSQSMHTHKISMMLNRWKQFVPYLSSFIVAVYQPADIAKKWEDTKTEQRVLNHV